MYKNSLAKGNRNKRRSSVGLFQLISAVYSVVPLVGCKAEPENQPNRKSRSSLWKKSDALIGILFAASVLLQVPAVAAESQNANALAKVQQGIIITQNGNVLYESPGGGDSVKPRMLLGGPLDSTLGFKITNPNIISALGFVEFISDSNRVTNGKFTNCTTEVHSCLSTTWPEGSKVEDGWMTFYVIYREQGSRSEESRFVTYRSRVEVELPPPVPATFTAVGGNPTVMLMPPQQPDVFGCTYWVNHTLRQKYESAWYAYDQASWSHGMGQNVDWQTPLGNLILVVNQINDALKQNWRVRNLNFGSADIRRFNENSDRFSSNVADLVRAFPNGIKTSMFKPYENNGGQYALDAYVKTLPGCWTEEAAMELNAELPPLLPLEVSEITFTGGESAEEFTLTASQPPLILDLDDLVGSVVLNVTNPNPIEPLVLVPTGGELAIAPGSQCTVPASSSAQCSFDVAVLTGSASSNDITRGRFRFLSVEPDDVGSDSFIAEESSVAIAYILDTVIDEITISAIRVSPAHGLDPIPLVVDSNGVMVGSYQVSPDLPLAQQIMRVEIDTLNSENYPVSIFPYVTYNDIDFSASCLVKSQLESGATHTCATSFSKWSELTGGLVSGRAVPIVMDSSINDFELPFAIEILPVPVAPTLTSFTSQNTSEEMLKRKVLHHYASLYVDSELGPTSLDFNATFSNKNSEPVEIESFASVSVNSPDNGASLFAEAFVVNEAGGCVIPANGYKSCSVSTYFNQSRENGSITTEDFSFNYKTAASNAWFSAQDELVYMWGTDLNPETPVPENPDSGTPEPNGGLMFVNASMTGFNNAFSAVGILGGAIPLPEPDSYYLEYTIKNTSSTAVKGVRFSGDNGAVASCYNYNTRQYTVELAPQQTGVCGVYEVISAGSKRLTATVSSTQTGVVGDETNISFGDVDSGVDPEQEPDPESEGLHATLNYPTSGASIDVGENPDYSGLRIFSAPSTPTGTGTFFIGGALNGSNISVDVTGGKEVDAGFENGQWWMEVEPDANATSVGINFTSNNVELGGASTNNITVNVTLPGDDDLILQSSVLDMKKAGITVNNPPKSLFNNGSSVQLTLGGANANQATVGRILVSPHGYSGLQKGIAHRVTAVSGSQVTVVPATFEEMLKQINFQAELPQIPVGGTHEFEVSQGALLDMPQVCNATESFIGPIVNFDEGSESCQLVEVCDPDFEICFADEALQDTFVEDNATPEAPKVNWGNSIVAPAAPVISLQPIEFEFDTENASIGGSLETEWDLGHEFDLDIGPWKNPRLKNMATGFNSIGTITARAWAELALESESRPRKAVFKIERPFMVGPVPVTVAGSFKPFYNASIDGRIDAVAELNITVGSRMEWNEVSGWIAVPADNTNLQVEGGTVNAVATIDGSLTVGGVFGLQVLLADAVGIGVDVEPAFQFTAGAEATGDVATTYDPYADYLQYVPSWSYSNSAYWDLARTFAVNPKLVVQIPLFDAPLGELDNRLEGEPLGITAGGVATEFSKLVAKLSTIPEVGAFAVGNANFIAAKCIAMVQLAADNPESSGINSPITSDGKHWCNAVPIYMPGYDLGVAAFTRSIATAAFPAWTVQARVNPAHRDWLGGVVDLQGPNSEVNFRPYFQFTESWGDKGFGPLPEIDPDHTFAAGCPSPRPANSQCDEFPNKTMASGGKRNGGTGNTRAIVVLTTTKENGGGGEGTAIKNFYKACDIHESFGISRSQAEQKSPMQHMDWKKNVFLVVPIIEFAYDLLGSWEEYEDATDLNTNYLCNGR